MNEHPWLWDDDEVRAALARARRRIAYARAAAAIVVLYMLVQGVVLYPRLPARLPLDVSGPSPTTMQPDSYVPKNPITAFAGLLFGVVFAVMWCRTEAKRDWSHWPGWEKAQLLTDERREYLLMPVREAMQAVGATVAVTMALTQLGMWDLALHRGTLLGYWPFPVGVTVAMVEGIPGGIIANRRRKAALG